MNHFTIKDFQTLISQFYANTISKDYESCFSNLSNMKSVLIQATEDTQYPRQFLQFREKGQVSLLQDELHKSNYSIQKQGFSFFTSFIMRNIKERKKDFILFELLTSNEDTITLYIKYNSLFIRYNNTSIKESYYLIDIEDEKWSKLLISHNPGSIISKASIFIKLNNSETVKEIF